MFLATLLFIAAQTTPVASATPAEGACPDPADTESVCVSGDNPKPEKKAETAAPAPPQKPLKVTIRFGPRFAFMMPGSLVRAKLSIRIENGGDRFWCPEYEILWGDGTKTGPNGPDCGPYEEASPSDREVQVLPREGYSIYHGYGTEGTYHISVRLLKSGQVIYQDSAKITVNSSGGGSDSESSEW